MEKRRCLVCDAHINATEHNRRIYCSNKCKSKMRNEKKKIQKANDKLDLLESKCRRCLNAFPRNKEEHRHYCSSCIEITEDGKEIHKCLDCKTSIPLLRKRCEKCAPKAKITQIQKLNSQNVEKSKALNIKYKNKTKKINPKFLVRNYSKVKFSNQGITNSFGL